MPTIYRYAVLGVAVTILACTPSQGTEQAPRYIQIEKQVYQTSAVEFITTFKLPDGTYCVRFGHGLACNFPK